MFGKRHALRKPSGGGELALAVDAALDIVAKLSRPAMSGAPVAALDAARSPALVIRSRRSEGYYDIKSSIFNALIDTIDLTQLGQLELVDRVRGSHQPAANEKAVPARDIE